MMSSRHDCEEKRRAPSVRRQKIAPIGVWLVLAATSAPVLADSPTENLTIKLSGYANSDLAIGQRPSPLPLAEAELEVTPQYKLPSGTVIAVRAALNGTAISAADSSKSQISIPEISVFAIGSFGRIEIGYRAGFPQSLVGFTPSEIAFTAAEFGPESGSRLDPDGRLPTAFLSTALRDRIDRLSYLGYAARFYSNRSAKVIYLTPRLRNGLYGAISYAPRTDRQNGLTLAASRPQTQTPLYRDLVQAAMVWTHRTEIVDLSVGATLSHAVAVPRAGAIAVESQATSLSGGVTATFNDKWTVGISATYDGWSSRRVNDPGHRAPYGIVGSINYVDGPWIAGGYYQHAAAAADTTPFAWDDIDVVQFGLSYLADKNHDLLGAGSYTDVKLFTSVYRYDIRRSAAIDPLAAQRGIVALAGIRFSFF